MSCHQKENAVLNHPKVRGNLQVQLKVTVLRLRSPQGGAFLGIPRCLKEQFPCQGRVCLMESALVLQDLESRRSGEAFGTPLREGSVITIDQVQRNGYPEMSTLSSRAPHCRCLLPGSLRLNLGLQTRCKNLDLLCHLAFPVLWMSLSTAAFPSAPFFLFLLRQDLR